MENNFFFLQCAVQCRCRVHSSISICARGSLFDCNFFLRFFFSLHAKEIVQLTTCNENIPFYQVFDSTWFTLFLFLSLPRTSSLSPSCILFMFSQLIFPLQIDLSMQQLHIVPQFVGTNSGYICIAMLSCIPTSNHIQQIFLYFFFFFFFVLLLVVGGAKSALNNYYNIRLQCDVVSYTSIYALKHNDCLLVLFHFCNATTHVFKFRHSLFAPSNDKKCRISFLLLLSYFMCNHYSKNYFLIQLVQLQNFRHTTISTQSNKFYFIFASPMKLTN